jgi:hypothetical protein
VVSESWGTSSRNRTTDEEEREDEPVTWRELKRYQRRRSWALLAVFITMILFAGISVEYTVYSINANNAKFCDLLGGRIRAYQVAPPLTQAGKVQEATEINLYKSLKCPELR